MKKIALILLVITLITVLLGCSEKKEIVSPDISQIRSICNLATLECRYHNVAKGKKDVSDGLTHLFEKEREFWIEYTGVVKVGIDLSKVKIETNNDKVTVYLPNAKVLESIIDPQTLNENSYIASADGWNKNKITADDQTAAIKKAQENMEKEANNNGKLLLQARDNAEKLLKNYIDKLGEFSGVEYKITWKYE